MKSNPLKKILKKHPNAVIHYYDKESWGLYDKDPARFDDAEVLLDIDDYTFSDGYTPGIVVLLCEMIGLKNSSI